MLQPLKSLFYNSFKGMFFAVNKVYLKFKIVFIGMKTTHKLLLALFAAATVGCFDNQELEPPQMTLSYDPEEYINYSWRNPVAINVTISSEEDIERFVMESKPAWWGVDTTFPPYTHYANFDVPIKVAKGKIISDSVAILTFRAYCNGLCNEQFRKLKYEIQYPEIDSFDVEMSPDPINGNCLLSIEDKEAFKYTEYRNRNFDLVLVKEDRTLWRNFGLGFASPDAEKYLFNYFEYRVPDYEYNDELTNLHLRKSITYKYSDHSKSFEDLTPKMIDEDERWPESYLGDDEGLGRGLSNLELQTLYKVKLQNGKKAVLRITELQNYDSQYPTVVMTVYYQK